MKKLAFNLEKSMSEIPEFEEASQYPSSKSQKYYNSKSD